MSGKRLYKEVRNCVLYPKAFGNPHQDGKHRHNGKYRTIGERRGLTREVALHKALYCHV